MNLTHLREKYQELLDYLKDSNYSKSYIQKVTAEINWILDNCSCHTWKSYQEITTCRTNKSKSVDAANRHRLIIALIARFEERGVFPDGTQWLKRTSSYDLLNSQYKGLIDFYYATEMSLGQKKKTSIMDPVYCTSSFLLFFQKKGITDMEKISEEDVLSYFCSGDGQPLKGYGDKKHISSVFKIGEIYHPACKKILSFLPKLKSGRKNIQYLTEEEISKIKATVHDYENSLSLRDRAIGMFLLYTGLRRSDIAGLMLESIDWDHEVIRTEQKKTGVPLELPLIPMLGNAVYDYWMKERPDSGDGHLFVGEKRPNRGMTPSAIDCIADKIYKASGIRQKDGDRRGTHIFRHYLATSMLGCRIPQPVISEILGHTSPSSLEPYLYADLPHLKDCALSIHAFPVAGEVFGE